MSNDISIKILQKNKFFVIDYKSDGFTTSFMLKLMTFSSENNQNKW